MKFQSVAIIIVKDNIYTTATFVFFYTSLFTRRLLFISFASQPRQSKIPANTQPTNIFTASAYEFAKKRKHSNETKEIGSIGGKKALCNIRAIVLLRMYSMTFVVFTVCCLVVVVVGGGAVFLCFPIFNFSRK